MLHVNGICWMVWILWQSLKLYISLIVVLQMMSLRLCKAYESNAKICWDVEVLETLLNIYFINEYIILLSVFFFLASFFFLVNLYLFCNRYRKGYLCFIEVE